MILWHQIEAKDAFDRKTHFDLMLESGESLRTWAVDRWPLNVGESCAALPLANHRIAYLDYEGPVSGDRGQVTRVEHGTFRVTSETGNQVSLCLELSRQTNPAAKLNVFLSDNQLTIVS